MILQPIPVARTGDRSARADPRAPLRRSLPAGTRTRGAPAAWVWFGAALLFFDIEFGLAYALHFVSRLFG